MQDAGSIIDSRNNTKGVAMDIWEKVNIEILRERLDSDCRYNLQRISRNFLLEGIMELVALKVNQTLEDIEKTKHEKIGEWLKAQSDKRAKESALLFEMLEYGFSYYNKLKGDEMIDLDGCYCKRSNEAYKELMERGYSFRGRIHSNFYVIYKDKEFGSPIDIGDAREIELKDGEFVEVQK